MPATADAAGSSHELRCARWDAIGFCTMLGYGLEMLGPRSLIGLQRRRSQSSKTFKAVSDGWMRMSWMMASGGYGV